MKLFIMITLLLFCCSMMGHHTDKEFDIKILDSVTLFDHDKGRGVPCLYLHGGPGAGNTWMTEMGGEEQEKRFKSSSSLNKITVDAQNEVVGGCIKKGGKESGINATSRFPMYSVMKFPQALYVADFLTKNNIELNTEVMVNKEKLMQDTWSPMLNTFEDQRTFTYAELLALSLQQSDNNACDILFEQFGGAKKVGKYIRDLGFNDICIQKTEKQMHTNPALSNENWCTPQSMVELLDWFIAHHNDNEALCFIWKLMAECKSGEDRLPAAIPNTAKVVHKTGTGYPFPSGQLSGICDVGIIIFDNGQQLPIAVFISNPSSQSKISDVAKQLLEL